MKLKKKYFIFLGVSLLFFLLLSINVNASLYNQSQMNDGSTIKNFTFSTNESQTFYIILLKNSTVISSKLNLTGYNINITNPSKLIANETSTVYQEATSCSITSITNANDTNWNTYAYCTAGGSPSSSLKLLENYSYNPQWENSQYFNLSIIVKVNSTGSGNDFLYLWNYTSGNWQTVDVCGSCSGTPRNISEYNLDKNSFVRTNQPLMVKITIAGGINTVYGIWESQLFWYNNSYPTDPYFDAASSSSPWEWSYSGEYTSVNTPVSNFYSQINNYLSGCTANSTGYCNVPFSLHSDTPGIIQVSAINLTYTDAGNYTPSVTITYNPPIARFGRFLNITQNDTFNVTVTDIMPLQTCNISANSKTWNNQNFSSNSSSYAFNITDGLNVFTANCSNELGFTTNEIEIIPVYLKRIDLIREDDGSTFTNFTQLTLLRAIDTTNSSIFDFKTYNDSTFYFATGSYTEKIKIEKKYVDLLFVDLVAGLLPSTTRVCVADSQQFYENIFYSSQQQPIALKNSLGNCYVLIGYISYAYQNALMAKVYTISSNYELYTIDDDLTPPTYTFLSSIDGSAALIHNFDAIEYAQTQPEFSLLTDHVITEKTTNTTLMVWYINQKNDNIQTDVTFKTVNGITLYTWTETTVPNNFTFTWDFSTVSDTLVSTYITKHKGNGYTETSRIIINLVTTSGKMPAGLVAILAIALTFFGLTFTASKYTFGWFGIIIMVIALAVTFMADATIYLRLIQAALFIITFFIVLVYKDENVRVT